MISAQMVFPGLLEALSPSPSAWGSLSLCHSSLPPPPPLNKSILICARSECEFWSLALLGHGGLWRALPYTFCLYFLRTQPSCRPSGWITEWHNREEEVAASETLQLQPTHQKKSSLINESKWNPWKNYLTKF